MSKIIMSDEVLKELKIMGFKSNWQVILECPTFEERNRMWELVEGYKQLYKDFPGVAKAFQVVGPLLAERHVIRKLRMKKTIFRRSVIYVKNINQALAIAEGEAMIVSQEEKDLLIKLLEYSPLMRIKTCRNIRIPCCWYSKDRSLHFHGHRLVDASTIDYFKFLIDMKNYAILDIFIGKIEELEDSKEDNRDYIELAASFGNVRAKEIIRDLNERKRQEKIVKIKDDWIPWVFALMSVLVIIGGLYCTYCAFTIYGFLYTVLTILATVVVWFLLTILIFKIEAYRFYFIICLMTDF